MDTVNTTPVISTDGHDQTLRKWRSSGLEPMKQLASFSEPEEAEISEMLDKVLLCTEKVESLPSTCSNRSRDTIKDKQIALSAPEFIGGWGLRRR
ncbi:hypothetical protein SAY86_018109 [Trapa natans]|uniref:Uncharacterized protein n=1 Tax=Trapa natans TaxID=22666 RepID=A0AAN7LMU9_TRANT|nr:hypothetical protein SAY86_018109 [Trapa natans]